MGDVAGSFAPAIFLLSDGEPTDDYKKHLADLKNNNWFKKAIKAAVAIGDDAKPTLRYKLRGTPHSILRKNTQSQANSFCR